jgi:hypothetical protein
MNTPDEFDDPSAIWADSDRPGLFCAYIDEDLSARVARAIAQIHREHGHQHFYNNRGAPVPWGVSINTSLKDALANGFKSVEQASAYDAWIAALEEAAAYLRREKAEYETELATTMCAVCGHSLAAHLHAQSPELNCGEAGCGCARFPAELVDPEEPPKRVLRLIKGGKDP